MTIRRDVLISDIQVPFHHKRGIDVLARFIRDWEPDNVLAVGDVCDFPSLSRWHRGLAGEFDTSLGKQRDAAVRILEKLQVKHLSRSNHDERIELYIRQKAPALDGLDELRLERFLRLDDLGIEFHRNPHEFRDGWYLMHGDEGGLSSEPGKTALNLARRVGASVVCGHTHRMGIQPYTESVGGRVARQRFGFEVGCLMDMSKAAYIMERGGSANWQLGFGVLYTDGAGRSLPVPIYMNADGTFLFEGRVWR